MKRWIGKLGFPIVILVVIGIVAAVVSRNYNLTTELLSQGKEAVTVATPGIAGPAGASAYETWLANGHTGTEVDFLNWLRGDAGADGVVSTAAVATAVENYCSDGKCDGKNPTPKDVAVAVATYCNGGKCDGADATAAQIATAVANFCAGGACKGATGAKGEAGSTGATGATGAAGQDAPRLQTACGTYTLNGTTIYVNAYKYDTETEWSSDDQQGRWSQWQCTNPVTVTKWNET